MVNEITIAEKTTKKSQEGNFETLIYCRFPSSRGLFSVVFAELTGARKGDLCPRLKRTVLSMRHGYLATEPSRDAMLLCGLTK